MAVAGIQNNYIVNQVHLNPLRDISLKVFIPLELIFFPPSLEERNLRYGTLFFF